MTTRSEGKVPETLPARPCEERDLDRDYVGEGREYHGHNGACLNCGATYSEAEDSDLATAHWMHTLAVMLAIWERDTLGPVKALARVMDPDDPMSATEHAQRLVEWAR